MIEKVVFDLGNVIADWSPRYLFSRVIDDPERLDFFLTRVCNMAWLNQINRGRPVAEAVRQVQREHPDFAREAAAYFDRWEETIAGTVSGVPEIVESLRVHGRGLFLFTNLPAEVWQRTRAVLPVLAHFDGYFISGVEGYVKPDPGAYQVCARRFSLTPGRFLFVDDDPTNVAAAHGQGWRSEVFRSAAQLRTDLTKFELLPPTVTSAGG